MSVRLDERGTIFTLPNGIFVARREGRMGRTNFIYESTMENERIIREKNRRLTRRHTIHVFTKKKDQNPQ